MRRELAEALDVDPRQVYVRKLVTKSGTRTTVGVAHVYDDPALARVIEPKHILERNITIEGKIEEASEETEEE